MPLGTTWTANGKGSNFGEIYLAFRQEWPKREFPFWLYQDVQFAGQRKQVMTHDMRTNLRLTGWPIQDYDWERLTSEAFRYE